MERESHQFVPFTPEELEVVKCLLSEIDHEWKSLCAFRETFRKRYNDDDGRDFLLRGVREVVTRGLINLDDYLPEKPAEPLTPLQEKIWRLLSQGFDRVQIAQKLGYVYSSSFQSPMIELLCRLGVPNKYAAAAMGVRMGKDSEQNG